MGNQDHLVAILEEMRAGLTANDKGAVVIEPTPVDQLGILPPELDDPPWKDEEVVLEQTKEAELVPFKNPRKELVFLPLAIQSAWMPRQGSPETYIRRFRSSTIVSSQGYTRSGRPVGLCSGLMSRRILLSLVTRATMEKSRLIKVPSIKELHEFPRCAEQKGT